MAKKLGKALVFTALASAAVAGGIALYNKYKSSSDDFDDDFFDFDDEDDDFDNIQNDSVEREYVSIPTDEAEEEVKTDEKKVNVDVSIDTSTFKDDDDETTDDGIDFFTDEDETV